MTELKPLKTATRLKRISSGVVAGLVIAALGWSATSPWHALTLKTGVTVSLVLATVCGLLTLKWGNKFLSALLDGMNFPWP